MAPPSFVEDRSAALNLFAKLASLMAYRGVVRLDVKVVSIMPMRNNRFKVLSRYSEIDSGDNVISRSDVTHYFKESPSGPIVEMVESCDCPLAAIWKPEEQWAS